MTDLYGALLTVVGYANPQIPEVTAKGRCEVNDYDNDLRMPFEAAAGRHDEQIRAAEREKCAGQLEEMALHEVDVERTAALLCGAVAIRARGVRARGVR